MARIKEGDKLYLVTRGEVAPGYRAVQAAHALRQFTAEFPELDREWFERSNYIALLEVPNEYFLKELVEMARMGDYKVAQFHEPDIGDQLTAIALEPSAKSICKSLSLALK